LVLVFVAVTKYLTEQLERRNLVHGFRDFSLYSLAGPMVSQWSMAVGGDSSPHGEQGAERRERQESGRDKISQGPVPSDLLPLVRAHLLKLQKLPK
jgi:hypothetical protein